MIRVDLDANVIVSGVLGLDREASTPGSIWRCWRNRAFTLIVAAPLVAEVERTLAKPYFAARLSATAIELAARSLRDDALLIELTSNVSGIATHHEDDLVIATALSASADYLVTGDQQLQALAQFRGITIVSPKEFSEIIMQSTETGA